MTDHVDPLLQQLIMWLGLPGTVLVVLTFAAVKFGWVKVSLPVMRRKDDDVIRDLTLIVKENTAAFVALRGMMEDSKGITLKVATTLDHVHTALAGLTGHIQGALQFIEPRPHREGRHLTGG